MWDEQPSDIKADIVVDVVMLSNFLFNNIYVYQNTMHICLQVKRKVTLQGLHVTLYVELLLKWTQDTCNHGMQLGEKNSNQ